LRRAGGGFVGFCTEDLSMKSPWILTLRQLSPPVSMVRSPTETGEKKCSIELPVGESTLHEITTIERWPIGSRDNIAPCTAFTIRSAPRLPVLPGREILVTVEVIAGRMANAHAPRTRKTKTDSAGLMSEAA
jgi:hypothetical protein